MTSRLALILTTIPALLLCISLASAQQNQAAIDAATQWVSLIDDGQYAESWDKAAPVFKDAISQQDWVKSLETVRDPLGAVVSRQLGKTAEVTTLPGAPEGRYLVMEFDTSYQNKSSTIETITAAQENGEWKIAGYYIR